ncbi:unnamed protein product [Rotaria sordida]|uniref:Fibronectin type-III domain-containing protein n=1 Tax=Rotaria sordida TaxID=392033 RepID=A0A813Y978_9BILA|nr:unnamed protein product [Rotaria sordida]CAF0880886.1 unnamed protein product [Rotaria sordida]
MCMFSGLASPSDITLNPNTGTVYVTDRGDTQRVAQIDPITRAIGTAAGGNGIGNAANQLSTPNGIFFDSTTNSLVIANSGAHNIVRWVIGATTGTVLAGTTGVSGNAATQLNNPTGVTFDSTGNMYVADRDNNRIQFFTPGQTVGTTIAGTGIAGISASAFNASSVVRLDNQGNLQHTELCNECDTNATWYCVQDDANFCDQHNTFAHSLKSQKSHKIVPIDEKFIIINNETTKPQNCKAHHMPLCLYCLFCKDVCCVACLSVDIHKQHSDEVKSVVDVANGEKKLVNEYLEKIRKLKTTFTNELNQLQQALKNIDISELKSNQEIDKEFNRIVECVEARRKILKTQLQQKSQTSRDHIYSKQEDLSNINSSLNKCLEEGRHILTLNDFAALSQSKTIIDQMKKLEIESVEYHHQAHLTDSIPFHIAIQTLLEMIKTSGIIGEIPAPSFVQQKCKVGGTNLEVEWELIDYESSITAYILELKQDNNNFNEVYRGLETKYHLQDLKPSTSYVLRLSACYGREIGNTTLLSLRTLDIDLNNWKLSMSSSYTKLNAENTRESLLDEQFTTGAATVRSGSGEWIKATFPSSVTVTSVTIAPLHKNPTKWNPANGNGGTLQYSHDDNNWITAGTIAYVEMQQQKIEVGSVTARYWQLFHNGHLGTSSFLFK